MQPNRPINNHVLVKITQKTDEILLFGQKVEVDTTYEPMRHARVIGEVVAVPEVLTFDDQDGASLQWETSMELKIGDECIIRWVDVVSAIAKSQSFETGGALFVYIKYDAFIVAKRKVPALDTRFIPPHRLVELDGQVYEIIMLNGYMLIEQDLMDFNTEFILPEYLQNKKALSGVIKFMGSGNSRYKSEVDSAQNPVVSNLPDHEFNLKIGDRVCFLQYADIDLEYEMHRTFMGRDGKFIRMQRNKILGKL